MEEADKEKADYFRSFGDGRNLLVQSRKMADELYGYDEKMHSEEQKRFSSDFVIDESTKVFQLAASAASSYELKCPLCPLLGFYRKIDLVDHCFRNRNTIFHEVL